MTQHLSNESWASFTLKTAFYFSRNLISPQNKDWGDQRRKELAKNYGLALKIQ